MSYGTIGLIYYNIIQFRLLLILQSIKTISHSENNILFANIFQINSSNIE